MSENRYALRKIGQNVAGRHLRRAVGALLCVFLTSCGGKDKALTIELGEPVAESESLADESTQWKNFESFGQRDAIAEESDASSTMLYVYVCGAVKEPGVVVLPEGSRCNDALEAAGGFAGNAAREAVNLAKLLSDGEQLYFPTVEEAESIANGKQAEDSGLVNINTAGVDILCTLPGIGEAKAKAIVLYREQNGGFGTVDEIMQVPGIKESAYSQMKDLITVQ